MELLRSDMGELRTSAKLANIDGIEGTVFYKN